MKATLKFDLTDPVSEAYWNIHKGLDLIMCNLTGLSGEIDILLEDILAGKMNIKTIIARLKNAQDEWDKPLNHIYRNYWHIQNIKHNFDESEEKAKE